MNGARARKPGACAHIPAVYSAAGRPLLPTREFPAGPPLGGPPTPGGGYGALPPVQSSFTLKTLLAGRCGRREEV